MNLTVISKLNLQMHRYVFHLRSLKSLIKATVDKVMTIEKAEPVVFTPFTRCKIIQIQHLQKWPGTFLPCLWLAKTNNWQFYSSNLLYFMHEKCCCKTEQVNAKQTHSHILLTFNKKLVWSSFIESIHLPSPWIYKYQTRAELNAVAAPLPFLSDDNR